MQTSIKCPQCGSQIIIMTELLIQGQKFACPNSECGATVSLALESQEVVRNAINKLEELKAKKDAITK